MSWFTKALSGTVGRKLLMSLSGLFLISFLVIHLLGNFALMKTEGTAFNEYANFMKTNPAIKVLEYVLFGGFILHIVIAVALTRLNKKARPVGYAYNKPSANSSWFSRNMGLTGFLILVFLLIHLKTFFFTHKVPLWEAQAATLYDEAVVAFSNPWYVLFYVIAMGFLSFHLIHAFQSAFQTLGLRHPKYTPFIRVVGVIFAIIVPALFALIPVYMYFTH
ncbi:MAG TPA: succinate dehydrogenase cytochrome b subunit [Cytophagaceae bacterium]